MMDRSKRFGPTLMYKCRRWLFSALNAISMYRFISIWYCQCVYWCYSLLFAVVHSLSVVIEDELNCMLKRFEMHKLSRVCVWNIFQAFFFLLFFPFLFQIYTQSLNESAFVRLTLIHWNGKEHLCTNVHVNSLCFSFLFMIILLCSGGLSVFF